MAATNEQDEQTSGERESVLGERMGAMSKSEVNEFLAGAWIAHLGCLTPAGAPYVVPAWYWWDGVAFWLLPRLKSVWAHYVARDPRVSLVIDEPTPPIRKVVVQGTAVVVEAGVGPYLANGEPSIWNQIGGNHMVPRYLGDEAAKYRNSVNIEPCWSIKVIPREIKTWQGVGWATKYHNTELHGDDGVAPTYYG